LVTAYSDDSDENGAGDVCGDDSLVAAAEDFGDECLVAANSADSDEKEETRSEDKDEDLVVNAKDKAVGDGPTFHKKVVSKKKVSLAVSLSVQEYYVDKASIQSLEKKEMPKQMPVNFANREEKRKSSKRQVSK
jgi:hypothetical protein